MSYTIGRFTVSAVDLQHTSKKIPKPRKISKAKETECLLTELKLEDNDATIMNNQTLKKNSNSKSDPILSK